MVDNAVVANQMQCPGICEQIGGKPQKKTVVRIICLFSKFHSRCTQKANQLT
jgi:hypothetical protein